MNPWCFGICNLRNFAGIVGAISGHCGRRRHRGCPRLEPFQPAYAVHREDACYLKCINLFAKSAVLPQYGYLRVC